MNLIPDSTLTCLKRGTPAKAPSGTLLSGLRLRIEVPLWRDLTAKHPTADLPAEEDSASDATGSAERSPRLALPVPVGFPVPSSLSFFFPRVRTPCGHGAQVIVEGGKVSRMVEKITRTTNKKPTEHKKGPQAASPPSCSLSSVLGETGETRKSV